MSLVVPGLIVLLLASGDSYEVWYMAAFVPAAIVSIKRYLTMRYRLSEDHIVVREGVIFRKTRHIPYARIQNIDTIQNPLHRLFRVVEVRLETAGGAEPEAVFRVVTTRQLEEIRAGVFADRAEAPAAESPESEDGMPVEPAPAPASTPFFRMRPLDVVYFGFLSQKGIVLLVGLLFVLWEFDVWERLVAASPIAPESLSSAVPLWSWILLGFLLFLALQALTVVWAFLTLFDFKISRSDEDLRTTCGLWTRQTATLPRHRIQFLSVREGLLQRLFKRISVKALTAGGDSTEDSQVSRKWLVPLCRRGTLPRVLNEVQPGLELADPDWVSAHPRAFARMVKRWSLVVLLPVALVVRAQGWLAGGVLFVLLAAYALYSSHKRARRLGFALTDTSVLLRDGVLTHVRNAVRFSKIQSVSLSQTPFDRRYRMATVRVDTAGQANTMLSFVVPFLALEDARALSDRLRHEAADTSFHW
jgi:putative membrane protein